MKKIVSLTALAIVAMAVSGYAALSTELADWGKGPAHYFMTKEDVAAWKNVRTDEAANAFIALFWARRDPTPDTPRNEFREDFERRVKAADDQFATKKLRGSMTERGKALVLYGVPTKIERTGTQRAGSMPQGISDDPANNPAGDDYERQVWTYEGDEAKTIFGVGKATIRFADRYGNGDFRADRSGTADLGLGERNAKSAALKQPGLMALPTFAPPPPPPPVILTELPTESLRAAVTEFKAAAKNPYDKQVHPSWGEFVTTEGETFVPVMLYVPKATGLGAAANLTFFGLVQDASGANVLAFEEPAKLTASKDDFFIDKSLKLGGGKHRAFLGLAENGKPLTMTSMELDLAGTMDTTATAVSPLILSNNIYPLLEAQSATDPFAFGGVKVVPKADHRFTTADELWYFFEMRNPGVPEAAAPVADAAAAAPADPAAVPAEVMPKLQVKIDVEGTLTTGGKSKKSAPPMEIGAIPMKGVPGHYGVGNAIPLATFKPGEYTFTVKVIDTVKKASYTLSDKFTIVE